MGSDSIGKAKPSSITAIAEKPFLRIESTQYHKPSSLSYNLKLRFSSPCKPYGILIIENKQGKKFSSNAFSIPSPNSESDNAWVNSSIELGLNYNIQEDKIRCYLFQGNQQIMVSEDSPAKLIPFEPGPTADGDRAPSAILEVLPHVPPKIAKKGRELSAVIEAVIDENGKVKRTKVHKTNNNAFGQNAKIAVESTRYYPALKNGKAIAVAVRLPFAYTP